MKGPKASDGAGSYYSPLSKCCLRSASHRQLSTFAEVSRFRDLQYRRSSNVVIMPIASARKSVKLAVRCTSGWVNSSRVPITEMLPKTRKNQSGVKEFLSERTEKRVIAMYAEACPSLSKAPICNCHGMTRWGKCVRIMTAPVERNAISNHLMLNNFSIFAASLRS